MAGRKRVPITSESYISIDGAPPVPTKSLSPEEWERCEKKMMENAGRVMSDYYSAKLANLIV